MNQFITNKFYDTINSLTKYDISDIHIMQDKDIYIRKADWVVVPVKWFVLASEEIYWFLHGILSDKEVELLMEGEEIDCSYEIWWYRFRINAYQTSAWINMALRKIVSKPQSMEEIGFSPELRDRIIKKNKWLILVTWSTGSWKSTSLASMINELNDNRNCHIITLEDPIEFVYENNKALVNQREIGKHSKSWINAIKYSLRQDPDVVMVWEMRDYETISAVLTLVETWHLVLSTLHTSDAVQTVNRIIDASPANRKSQISSQLSLALDVIVSQCLIKKADGKWRVPAREVMINTSAISNNIREWNLAQMHGIIETWMKYGMNTLDQSIARLVVSGQVNLNDSLSYIRNVNSFKNLLAHYKKQNEWFKPVD